MVQIAVSGINLEAVKSFREQDFNEENLALEVILRHKPIKDPNFPNRVTFNDSALYQAVFHLSELGKDLCYDLLVAWLVQVIQEGTVSRSFRIGNRWVLRELEEEYEKASLENLLEEERLKKIELRIKRILLEEEVKKVEDAQK